jgi:hypothetical protein
MFSILRTRTRMQRLNQKGNHEGSARNHNKKGSLRL